MRDRLAARRRLARLEQLELALELMRVDANVEAKALERVRVALDERRDGADGGPTCGQGTRVSFGELREARAAGKESAPSMPVQPSVHLSAYGLTRKLDKLVSMGPPPQPCKHEYGRQPSC